MSSERLQQANDENRCRDPQANARQRLGNPAKWGRIVGANVVKNTPRKPIESTHLGSQDLTETESTIR